MTTPAVREGTALGLAALGLIVALAPAPAHAAEPAAAAARAIQRVHEVKPGDTLGALARKYGVTVAAIVAANRLPGAGVLLRLGQRLAIPSPEAPAPAALPGGVKPTSPVSRAAPPAGPRPPAALILAVPDFDDASLPFGWPAEGPVTSTFGRRKSSWHRGIDIKAPLGTPVQAAAAGVVVASGMEARYGRVIKVEHAQGFVTVYAHNDANLVEVGDRVDAGETIATVGRTGRATTHHLHFEIRRDGRAYNPLYLLPLPPRIAQVDESDDNPPDE